MGKRGTRLNTKEKASIYSRTFGSRVYTGIRVFFKPRVRVLKNVKIER